MDAGVWAYGAADREEFATRSLGRSCATRPVAALSMSAS